MHFLTTLAGYVHWKLTGKQVLGVGDASVSYTHLYFVDQLPYTDEELVAMSELSLDDLKATAAGISIEDAAQRAGN